MIGAWCRRPSAAEISTAPKLGVQRLHLMVNDHSADRGPTPFRLDDRAREYAARIVDAGIELHITSWIMPHVEFLTAGCAELVQLAIDSGAHSIEWDAEEPWTRAVGGMRHADAAALMQLYGSREGVTGIGYADRDALQPLTLRAAYVTPQAYVTRTSGLRLDGIPRILARWEAMSGSATVIPALAAYRQDRGGPVDAWQAAGKPETVVLWALRHLDSPTARRMVGDLSAAMLSARGD